MRDDGIGGDVNATAECVAAENPDAAARWWGMALRVVVASALVGLFVSTLERTFGAVVDNLIYSECIGVSIFAVYVATRGTTLARHRPAFGPYLWRALVAGPIGYVLGVNLAAFLRGRPVGLPSLASMAPFALAVTVVSSACIMYFFWSRGRIAAAAQSEAEAQRTIAEARLRLLQTQIEPHMLFNTLANLRELVAIDPSRAETMIDELIVYLRATLGASRGTSTTLGAEFAQLAAYLALMKVRMADRLRVQIDLPAALADVPVPPMLLQPIVENAIKHGLEPKIGGGTIRIAARASGESLQIDVVDDGLGLRDGHAPGYGLTHVRERLQMLHRDAAAVTLDAADGGGVRVRVVLPMAKATTR